MSDEQMDDILRELRDDLAAVRPSPEFAAKVRMKVTAQPASGWFSAWRFATVVTVVACGIAAFAIMWPEKVDVPTVARQVPAPIAVASTQPPPVPFPHGATADAPRPMPQPAVRVPAVAAAPVLEPLVPPDQGAAVRRLLLSMRRGPVTLPSGETLIDEETGELKEPAAITIRPISVEFLPGPPEERGGGRSERR